MKKAIMFLILMIAVIGLVSATTLSCGSSNYDKCQCSVKPADITNIWRYIYNHESSWSSSSSSECSCSSSSVAPIYNYYGGGGMSVSELSKNLNGNKTMLNDYGTFQNYTDERYVLRSEYDNLKDRLYAIEIVLIEHKLSSMSEIDYKQAQVRSWRTNEIQYYNDFVCYPNGLKCEKYK
jgi:hypothetical protein